MASVTKMLFGGAGKSLSSGGFSQQLRPPTEEKSQANIKRRWSSDEQHRKAQPHTKEEERRRRDSVYAQRKAERAMMREHFREKYNLHKNPEDQQQVRVAGGKVRLPGDLRAVVHQEEPNASDFSIADFMNYKKLDLSFLKKGPMGPLQPESRCLVM